MMISRFLTTTHTRKTAFSRPSTKFHALQRTVKPGWGLSVERDEIKGGNAASSRHGGKTIPVVSKTKIGRGKEEEMKKEGKVVVVSSRKRKRAGEDARTHTMAYGRGQLCFYTNPNHHFRLETSVGQC